MSGAAAVGSQVLRAFALGQGLSSAGNSTNQPSLACRLNIQSRSGKQPGNPGILLIVVNRLGCPIRLGRLDFSSLKTLEKHHFAQRLPAESPVFLELHIGRGREHARRESVLTLRPCWSPTFARDAAMRNLSTVKLRTLPLYTGLVFVAIVYWFLFNTSEPTCLSP